MKKNIFLLGTCRTRMLKESKKYNFINSYENNFIGRTYSLIETYQLLNLISKDKKKIFSHEFRNNTKKFKNNIKNISIDNVELFLIEISSLKYFTHSLKNMDSNIVFSPTLVGSEQIKNNRNRYKMNTLNEEEFDYYFNKIIELLANKKIVFVCHLRSEIIPARKFIKTNLIKNIKKCNNNNISLVDPEELLNVSDISKYLDDDNHYNKDGEILIYSKFIELFNQII